MCVELYDVEGAYFSDGNGGLEFHALTTGRPITSADFIDKTPLKGRQSHMTVMRSNFS